VLGGVHGCGHKRIETTMAGTSKHDSLRGSIPDQKEKKMNFNEGIII
jgi:hypothetical protein